MHFFPSMIWASVAVLDRFSRCNSTRDYSGRKISWINGEQETAAKRRRADLEEKCDVFSGRWVFDNTSYPLYEESSCPYMSDQLACHKHGRPDLNYQYWRWQPHGCNLKRSSFIFSLIVYFILFISLWDELILLSYIQLSERESSLDHLAVLSLVLSVHFFTNLHLVGSHLQQRYTKWMKEYLY